MTSSLLLLSLVIAPSADAIAPIEGQGIEPQRLLTWEAAEQARAQQQPAWRGFQNGEGQGWKGILDPETGTPHRMYGPAIPFAPTSGDPSSALLTWVDAHADLLGADANVTRVRSSKQDPRTGTWYVDLDVIRGGAPIWRGGITARVNNGRLVMLGADTYPDVPLTGAFLISDEGAIAAAAEAGPAPEANHELVSVERFVLPTEDGGGVLLRPVVVVRTRTSEPPGRWFTFVDGTTGEVVAFYNEVRFATITGLHHERTLTGDLVESGLPFLELQSEGSTSYADATGSFALAGSITSRMRGEYVRTDNRNGSDATFTYTGDAVYTTSNATQAEIDSYVFLHHVYDWCQEYAPEVAWCNDQITSNVNVTSGSCNAYWDGTVNFYERQGSCNNTGQIGDVNYHEWGHGFHYFSLLSGTFDGSLSEGAADVVSTFQTADPFIAPYFYTSGGAIRELDSDMRYPEDYVDNPNYVHSNGLIFGGSIWDLWHILQDEYGDEVALEEASRIFTGTLKGGPTIPDSFYEALVADDDDGDLGNGSPNYCSIVEAFDLHGLADVEVASVGLSHTPLPLQPAEVTIPLSASLGGGSLDCVEVAGTGSLVWRVEGGAWQSVPLTVSPTDAAASIPAQPFGTYVEYYFELDSDGGGVLSSPSGGYINPYSTFIGDVIEVWCSDLEGDDGGFVHELVAGEEVEGADDWQWGEPLGDATDPSAAYSGNNVWGNDLGADNYNGEYQNDKHNRITSPEVDLLWYQGVMVQYQRWLGIEDGYFDRASILADGEIVWSNWGTDASGGEEHHIDTQWMPHSVALGAAADDYVVAVSWELESDGGLAYGGWNLDDVCVYAPATADNRLGIIDFVASDDADSDAVVMTWTHPRHAPVEQVKVVRRADRYPGSVDDGDVVYTEDAPTPGAAAEAVDETALGSFYYAVYGFDGTSWLSWTVEGWNADTGAASGTGEDPDPDGGTSDTPGTDTEPPTVEDTATSADSLVGKGCGCSTESSGGAPMALLGLAGLLAIRRRRA